MLDEGEQEAGMISAHEKKSKAKQKLVMLIETAREGTTVSLHFPAGK